MLSPWSSCLLVSGGRRAESSACFSRFYIHTAVLPVLHSMKKTQPEGVVLYQQCLLKDVSSLLLLKICITLTYCITNSTETFEKVEEMLVSCLILKGAMKPVL